MLVPSELDSLVSRTRSALERVLAVTLAHPRWVVALAAVAVYANTLGNQPVLDDGWVIFSNPLIKSLKNIPAIFHQPYNATLPLQRTGLYRPVTTLSYAINYALGGPNVVGYHLLNIALHALCCVVVFELARLLMGAARAATPSGVTSTGALLAALLFAVHPVHVEAVTAMVGRAELLAALGSLGCLYLTCTRRQATWRYPAALAALTLGVLSKENAAVTPLLFALVALVLPGAAGLEATPSLSSAAGRRALRSACALGAGMVSAVGLYFLLRPAGGGVPGEFQTFSGQSLGVVFNTMTRVVAQYLQLLVFPHPLGVDFYYSTKIPLTRTFTLACLADTVTWLAVLGCAIAAVRRAPLAAVGILWVFVALLPVLHIVPIGVLMAERLLYLPSVGFCLAVGAGAAWVSEHAVHRPGIAKVMWPATLAGVFLALAAKSWVRNRDWRDGLALWQDELRKEPNHPWVNNNLAMEYSARGQLTLARERLEVALRESPGYWRAQINLGLVFHKLHDDSAALHWLERAHELAPSAPEPNVVMANVLADEGKFAQAVEVLSQAEVLDPREPWTHLYRGAYLHQLNRLAEADAEVKRAVELDPSILVELMQRQSANAPSKAP